MAQISRFPPHEDDLNARRAVTIELPEFAIRALRYRADVANDGAAIETEIVSFNDVIAPVAPQIRRIFPRPQQRVRRDLLLAVPPAELQFEVVLRLRWLFEGKAPSELVPQM